MSSSGGSRATGAASADVAPAVLYVHGDAGPLEAIRAHALPELSSNLLNDQAQRELWTDDRWKA